MLLTLISGLIPSAQILFTSIIIRTVAQALRSNHPQALINMEIMRT